jgi:hypothetical protein
VGKRPHSRFVLRDVGFRADLLCSLSYLRVVFYPGFG